MVSKRTLTTSFLIAAMAIGAGAAVMAPSAAQAGDDKKLDCSTLNVAKVKDACNSGGEPAVKKLMNAMKKQFNDTNPKDVAGSEGVEFECKSCHKDGLLLKTTASGANTTKVLEAYLKAFKG
ncbi:MAG: hypothetical protein RJA70_3382 [Pseudomonadota bacterium]|jgi:hypothetical protein